ncbi:ABC transporter substrate-binding protein [Paenibacillus gansuensis]|uniref:ABC transporter substrate-binding protein n=1 Tax=Paenibacillus gansuensis TaxID=306542 RepID=A0ABW5PC21_9BACL
MLKFRNFQFHTLLALTLLLLMTAAVSGCALPDKKTAQAEDGGKVTIDFWTFWGSETRKPIIEKIIKDFNDSQDRIVVKHTYLPWGDIWTKNLASIASKNPADVIVNDINTVALRAEKKQVTDLTPYLAKDRIQDRFYSNLWKTGEYNGKVYSLPFVTDTRLLFYNKKAFQEAGLDPNKPPQTWDELEQYAMKLDKKNGGTYDRIGFYPLWGGFGWDNFMMNADGGTGFFDTQGNIAVNTPAKTETLDWINKWTKRYGQGTIDNFKAEFGKQQADPFIAGKVAMIIDTATFNTQLRDYGKGMEYGVAPIPERTPGSGHYSSGGGFVVEIPYGAKHPDEAWEFLKFLTDKAPQTYWAEKNFDIAANKAANEAPQLSKDPVFKAAVDNMQVTQMFPTPVQAPDFKKLIDPQVDAALLGRQSSKDALSKADQAVRNLMEHNK